MKAAILAGGYGTRLRPLTFKIPKPLILIMGVPLVERVIREFKEAEIDEVVLVLGYKGDLVEDYFTGKDLGVTLRFVHSRSQESFEAFAVLQDMDWTKPFILASSDLVFPAGAVQRFLAKAKAISTADLIVGVTESIGDLAPVFVVVDEAGVVCDFGKDLPKTKYRTSGLYLCSPAIFQEIQIAWKRNTHHFSEFVKILLGQGYRVVSCPMPRVLDIDTLKDLGEGEWYLLQTTGKASDGMVSRYINRKISNHITKLIVNMPIEPVDVSLFSLLLAMISSSAFALGLHPSFGGIVAQLCSIVSGVDGQLARLKYLSSPRGQTLNHMIGRVSDLVIFLGISYRQLGDPRMLIIAFLCFSSYLLLRYWGVVAELSDKGAKVRTIYFGRDFLFLSVMIGGILNLLEISLLINTILSSTELIVRLMQYHRRTK